MKQLKINSEIISGLQRLQRDSIQNHCLTLLRYDLPTEHYENNWEQAKTSTEVENV